MTVLKHLPRSASPREAGNGRLVVTDGLVLDGVTPTERRAHVGIDAGKIVFVTGDLPSEWRDAPRVDAAGAWVLPGFICLRTHVGEPGYEWREDVATASLAAAAGGFTTICATPDTNPINDVRAVTEQLMTRAAAAQGASVLPVGAATRGQEGRHLSEMGDLESAGCVAVSTGDVSVESGQMMRRILEYARSIGLRVFTSPAEVSMTRGGLMNEGLASLRLGLPGIPAEAESVAILRDGILSRLAEWPLHFQRVSTAAGVKALEHLAELGIPFTADCTPHHLWFDESAVAGFDAVTRVMPPLRSERDVLALRGAVASKLITAIATDHSPRTRLEKWVEYSDASPGTTGLETALGALLELARRGAVPQAAVLHALTRGPADVLVRSTIVGGRLVAVDDSEAEEVKRAYR
ncbi:MAG: amidohydrolase family protein [Myxococcales bacterium]|nr:amidohydrolase family protein [Myxococcales bacterium]